MNQDLACIAYPLPTDIQQLLDAGEFEWLTRLIDKRIADEKTPDALKRRLHITKMMAAELPRAYPYPREKAFALLKERIPDITAEEMDLLTDDRTLDWHFIQSKVHYRRNFISNLLRTRPEYASREAGQKILQEEIAESQKLDEIITQIREKGKVHARFEMKELLRFKNCSLKPGEKVRVWLPLPIAEEPVLSCRLLSMSHPASYIAPESALQRTVFFEVPYESGLEVSCTIAWENIAFDHIAHPQGTEKAGPIQADLEECLPHIVFTPYLRALAKDIVGGETRPLHIARKIYDFITTQCRYRFMPPYLTVSNLTENFLSNQRGDCGVQALAFITLCRLCGIPARWQSGQYTAPFSIGMHDWARFYIPEYGWLFADCSFGGSGFRNGSSLRHDFYFGSLEPWRLPLARQFQARFDPPMHFLRYDPYDNQIGEAEAQSRRLFSDETEDDQILLDYTLST